MLNTAFLTSQEQALFEALPDTLREGWKVEPETVTHKDSEKQKKLRFMLFSAYAPHLRVLIHSLESASTDKEMQKILMTADLKELSDTALAEIFFTMGPNSLSLFIVAMLEQVKDDEELERIVSLSVIRHSLLRSFSASNVL
jgi:hypothetical protein